MIRTYSVFGKTASTRSDELARILDDGTRVTFRVPGAANAWPIDRSTLAVLLDKYARFGYRVRHSFEPTPDGRQP